MHTIPRATCQICGRKIAIKAGVLAHHGYRRPHYRSGTQTASCFGARCYPFEASRMRLETHIANLHANIAAIDVSVARMAAEPRKILVREAQVRFFGGAYRSQPAVYIEPGAPTYPMHLHRWFAEQAGHRDALRGEVTLQQARYDGWVQNISVVDWVLSKTT